MLLTPFQPIIFLFLIFLRLTANAQETSTLFSVDPLFNFKQPETLDLSYPAGLETFTIFAPRKKDNHYNHGVVLFPFKGMLYAQWQSSKTDEDGADTQVFYSRSTNGKDWSKPIALTEKWNEGIKTSGGWWSHGDTLVAYICNWPAIATPKQGTTTYRTSTDGIHWGKPKSVLNNNVEPVLGIIEQDIHALPDGRIITAFHMQPGLQITPYFTDDPLGVSGWTVGAITRLPAKEDMSRELEPSWFYRSDSAVVMIFRDQASTFKKLGSISYDRGKTWSTPVLIDTPDSRAKQSAGNLPDGTAFMVNNPSGNKDRFPLVITLSKEGFIFNKAFAVRYGDKTMQPLRYAGKYKRPGFSYPKSVVWGDFLYIAYATNKEDVELTQIPLRSLVFQND